MKTITYDPNANALKTKFIVENGVIAVAYSIKLSEKDSSKTIAYYDGDNQNPEDDIFYLPMPIKDNDGRILRLTATFYPLDLELSKNYSIKLEVYQGETLLDYIGSSGNLNPSTQVILDFAKLKTNE